MRAVTRLAPDEIRSLDLNDIARGDGFLFVRDGVGFAGRGVALRIPFDDAPSALASIDHTDETGLTRPLGAARLVSAGCRSNLASRARSWSRVLSSPSRHRATAG